MLTCVAPKAHGEAAVACLAVKVVPRVGSDVAVARGEGKMMLEALYKVIIVEDDAEQLGYIASLVDQSPHAASFDVTMLQSIAELDRYLMEDSADIVLMDIVLDGRAGNGCGPENGIEAVSRHAARLDASQVIYLTGYVDFCESAYDTQHVGFLVKPITQSRLDKALDRAVKNLSMDSRRISVCSNGSVTVIPSGKIRFIESNRRKAKIHIDGGEMETYESLESLSSQLPCAFIRCHKGFIVNMDRIERLDGSDIRLATGEVIPISQRRRAAVRNALVSRLRERQC